MSQLKGDMSQKLSWRDNEDDIKGKFSQFDLYTITVT